MLSFSPEVIISPKEVFGDIMVLASLPPVDPDEVNTLNSKNMWVDTPLRYFGIEI